MDRPSGGLEKMVLFVSNGIKSSVCHISDILKSPSKAATIGLKPDFAHWEQVLKEDGIYKSRQDSIHYESETNNCNFRILNSRHLKTALRTAREEGLIQINFQIRHNDSGKYSSTPN